MSSDGWDWKDDYEDRDADGRHVAGVFKILDYVIAYAYWNYHTKNCDPTGSWDVDKLIKKRGEA